MGSNKKIADATPVRDPGALCPLVPGRMKGDCPARCRGCNFRVGGIAQQDAEVPSPGGRVSAAVCPRVPHRMKYTCSGKCPGCGAKQLQSLSSVGEVK